MKNLIGLPQEPAAKVASQLNDLLANLQIFYMNTRGLHWNIQGEKFFELHVKFEELYNDLQLKIDEVAERVLTLGQVPLHSFEDYLNTASILPTKDINDGKKAVENVLKAFETLLPIERSILAASGEMDDEGTNALMSDYIREQEKLVWMYSAFLK
jgi:starvation-inducible DNA-binding protein